MDTSEPVRIKLLPQYGLWKTNGLPERYADLPLVSRTSVSKLAKGAATYLLMLLLLFLPIFAFLYRGIGPTTPSESIVSNFLLVVFASMFLAFFGLLLGTLRIFTTRDLDIELTPHGLIAPRDIVGVLPWTQIIALNLDANRGRAFQIRVTLRDGAPIQNHWIRRIFLQSGRKNVFFLTLAYDEDGYRVGETILEAARQLGGATVKYPGV